MCNVQINKFTPGDFINFFNKIMDENEKVDDDDETRLPQDTLAILQQFLVEKEQREKLESEILSNSGNAKPPDVDFEENWVGNVNSIFLCDNNFIFNFTATKSILVLR